MSSDLFLLDGSFLCHSPDIALSDFDLQFLSDTFFPFPDLPQDIFHTFSNDPNQPPQLSDSFPFYSHPPSQKMHSLSLNPASSAPAMAEGNVDFGVLDTMGVKKEDGYNFEKVGMEMIQRSLRTQSLDRKPTFLSQSHFSPLLVSPSLETQMANSSENRKFEGPMRRASSTGDLQSPSATENSFMDDAAAFKVGRYSAEERKQRINRYRSKRTQRNFNKTIKYACRKTLADSRPRVRGRFARNDETDEIPIAICSQEDEEELWIHGLHEEKEELMALRDFANGMNPQFQYLGF